MVVWRGLGDKSGVVQKSNAISESSGSRWETSVGARFSSNQRATLATR